MPISDCKIGPAAAISDMKRAAEFYEGKLGLEPSNSNDEMRVYPCGEGTALMVYVSDHAGGNKATLAGFDAGDFDALFAELSDRGVEFERYEDESGVTTDERGIFETGGFKAAWFKDPDGNIFSLNG